MTGGLGGSAQKGPYALLATAAFALPALSLALPSGYSWGALLLVLGGAWALATPAGWGRATPSWSLMVFGGAAVAMATVWLTRVDIDWRAGVKLSDFDRSAKVVLALLAIPLLSRMPPPARWLRYGCWAGAGLAGLTAAWQVYEQGAERAAGYTNAIQFGNIALLLAFWSALWWRHASHRWERAWAAAAVGTAGFASVASGTRGGWVVAPVLVLFLVWLRARGGRSNPIGTTRLGGWMLVAAAVAAVVIALGGTSHRWTALENRLAQVHEEWTLYHTHGVSDSSIGHRLAHWTLAWQLGKERPLLGWSEAGYEAEKQRRVERGEAPPVVLQFGHAHHEWLDLWAKAGLVGIGALASFYIVPLWMYARALRRAWHSPPGPDREEQQTIAACGLVLVVGFFGFGMTQVMFAHNSGVMMYLFMNLLWLGALRSLTTPKHP